MTEDRNSEIDDFLKVHGWAGAKREALAGDASHRRYERIVNGQRRAVLMDAAGDPESIGPFMVIDRYLRDCGYSAPEIYAADEAVGLMLLEDLGDDLYTGLIDDGEDQRPLFAAAMDVLIDLHGTTPDGLAVPTLDSDRLIEQLDVILDWYAPEIIGAALSNTLREDFFTAWRAVLPLVAALPTCLVLYDYHAPNLIWLPDRRGLGRVGLLDFQDAMIGPLAFDVVSLLENPRQDTDPALVDAMIARYLAARPEIDRQDFATAYAVLGAQRVTRNVGNFTRLWRRDGKPAYLDHLPRLWRLLDNSLGYPALAPVAAWFDAVLPPSSRRNLR